MKKFASLLIVIAVAGSLSLTAGELSPKTKNQLSVGMVKSLKMPFSSSQIVEMELVYTKGNYSLWKCEDAAVDKYPQDRLTGKTYKYFVYKNEKYHLAVKENNKDDIFRFFSANKTI
jgi:hypothetical protein